MEVETVPEPPGEEDHPTGPQAGPQQLAAAGVASCQSLARALCLPAMLCSAFCLLLVTSFQVEVLKCSHQLGQSQGNCLLLSDIPPWSLKGPNQSMACSQGQCVSWCCGPFTWTHFQSSGWVEVCSCCGPRKTGRPPEPAPFPLCLQVLFTPATQAARQAACTIVEALATVPSRKQQVLDLLTRYHMGQVGTVAGIVECLSLG